MKKQLRIISILVAMLLIFYPLSASYALDATDKETYSSMIHYQVIDNGVLKYYEGVELEEILDPNDSFYYLDSEDFDSWDDYRDYCIRNNIEPETMPEPTRSGNSSIPTVSATGVYAFELIYDHAIQSFAVDGSNIYISQAYTNLSFGGTNYPINPDNPDNLVLITKCKKKPGSSKIYIPDSYMLLKGVGHGQTLEVYKDKDNTKYLLVSCGGVKADTGNNRWWSTQIGRVIFTPGATIENYQIKRLTNLNCIVPNNNTWGGVKRADAALSADGKTLLLWVRSTSNKTVFAGYNFETINTLLNTSGSYTLSFASDNTLKNAHVFSFFSSLNTMTSMQGLDMSNKSSNKYTIFMSSGNESNNAYSANHVYQFDSTGSSTSLKGARIDDSKVWSLYGSQYNSYDATAEIEGAKLNGSYIQFVLRDTGNGMSGHQVIAKIAKSKLKQYDNLQ